MDPNERALELYSKRQYHNQVEDEDLQITGIHYKPCICCNSPYSESSENAKKAKIIMDQALNDSRNMQLQVKEEPKEFDGINLRSQFYGAEIGEPSSRPMLTDSDEIAVKQEPVFEEENSDSGFENQDVVINEESNPERQLVSINDPNDYLGRVRVKEEPASFPEFIFPQPPANIDQQNYTFPPYASYMIQQPSDGSYGSYIMHTETVPTRANFYPNQPGSGHANFYPNQPGPGVGGFNNQNRDEGIGTEYFRRRPNMAFDFDPVTNINLIQRFDMLNSQNRVTLSYTQTNETYFVPTVNPPYQVDRSNNIEVRVIQDECRMKPTRIVLIYDPTHLVSEEDNASVHITKLKFLKLITPKS